MMKRLITHLLFFPWRLRRLFPRAVLQDIEAAIRDSERRHAGQIRFAIEDSLHPISILRRKSPRLRALEVFSQLHVWDTEQNNGVLIYLLLAERQVEIVADRGIAGKVAAGEWAEICQTLQARLQRSESRQGVPEAIAAVGALLQRHYPGSGNNELDDRPVLL